MSLYDLTQLQNKTLQEQTQEIRKINDRKPVVSKLPEQTDLVGRAQEYEQKVREESLRVNYGLTLNANQYQTIANAMAASDNPSETEAKFAQALVYSQEYGIDLTTAVENLDSLNNARFGHTVPYAKAGYQAVVDSFMIGHYGIKLAELADQRYEIEKQGGDPSAVKFEMQQINQWIEDHQDNVDRGLVTTLLKLGAQSIPYTMKIFTTGATAGGIAAGLGALVGGPAGAAIAGTIYKWASTAAGFAKGVQLVKRVQYYDLVDNGVDPEVAEWASTISAVIQSAVEQFLGIEGGINSAISHLASGTTTKILAGMYAKGTFRKIASVAGEYFKTGVSEGIEEFLQQITEDVSNNIAYELSELPEGKKSTKEVIHNAVQSFVGGFGASLVLGIAPTAINAKASLRYAQDIRTDAQETDSRKSFINKHKSDEAFEGYSAKTVNDTLSKIYDNARETMTSEERGADVITNEEASTIEVGEDQGTEELLDEQGNVIEEFKATSKQPTKPLTRTAEGRLVTKESADVRLQADGSEKHILLLGGTDSKDVYGRVEYSLKDNTVRIDRVTSFSGYEDIQADGIKELMRRYEGYEFEWDPSTEAQEKIKADLLSGNPLQNGKLNWFDGSYDAKTSIEVGRIVGQAFTNLSEDQKATAGAMLQVIADAQGTDVNTFIKNNIQQFGTIDTAGKRGAFQMLKDNEGNFKAVIYAGKGHDYSSFSHEMFHLVRQISDKSADLAAAFKSSVGTEQFKKFSMEHWNILGQYFDSFDEIKSAIEAFEDGAKWTRDQEELAALYFEAYQQEGKTFSAKLKNLFQKISEWFSRIYNTMKHNTQLNDDIIKAYDSMLESNEQLRQENAASETTGEKRLQIGVKELPAWVKEMFGEPISEKDQVNGLDEDGNPLFQEAVEEDNDGILYQNLYDDDFRMGNGYDWERKMSRNAVQAYESGEKPLHKWTKDSIITGLKNETSEEIANILKVLPVGVLKEAVLEKTSWHHTGSRFNKTDFYSIKDLSDVTREDAKGFIAAYNQNKKDIERAKLELEKIKNAATVKTVDGEFATSEGRFENSFWDLWFITNEDKFKNVNIPQSIKDFLSDDIELSKSYKIYRTGHKPVGEIVSEGTRRITDVENGFALQEYKDGKYVTLDSITADASTYDLIGKIKGTYKGTEEYHKVIYDKPKYFSPSSFGESDSYLYQSTADGAMQSRIEDNITAAKDYDANIDEQGNVTLYTDGQLYSNKQHKGFEKAPVSSAELEVSEIRGDEIIYRVRENGQVEYQDGPEMDMLAGFARVYDTYEEFKAEMERPDFEFLVSALEDGELRAIWEQEHNIVPEIEFSNDEYQAVFSRNEGYVSPVTEDMDEQQKTAAYRARISTDEGIRGFIMRLRQLADFNHESGGGRRLAAGSQEDYDNMMNELEIFGRVYREAAPFIRSLMFSKKDISDKAILEVRGMMLKEENELMYRDLYADVMLDPNLRADVYNRTFDLNDPGFGYENKTIAQRAKMFSRQDTADWIAKVQSGQIKDPELKKHIENIIEERNSLREQLEEKTRTLSSVRTQLAKSERDHLQMIEDNAREANQLRNFIQKVQEKIGNGRRMTAEEFKKVNSASERIAILNEEMKQLRKDDKAKAAAERREAIYKAQTQIRDQYREKQEQISKAKELQEHKENLAHIITSPRLNEDVNWEQRAEIQAIAAAVDPNNRRDKIRVAGKPMTVPELRAAIERGDIKLENITPYMLTRLTKTPLNEWTVSELEEMAEYVESLRTLGKQIWQAKIDKRNMIAEQLRNQIIHTVQANRLHPETTPIPNSEEARQLEKKWRTKFKNTFNKTLGIDRKAQRLDNNTQGTAWDILVDQRRKLDNEEYQAIQKRVQPIYKLMEEKGIKPADLYQKVSVYLDGARTTMMTYSDLAFGLFAEKDPQTYEAFAYGDLVTQREKEFERAQTSNDDEWNDRIRRMGDDRYRNFKQAAQGAFYQHPEYLEFFQAIDNEWQKPENFERANAVTQEEYNITQDKVEHYMRIYRTQQNGSQMAATQAAEMRAKYSPQSKSTPQKGQTKKRINILPAFQTPTRMDMLGTWLKSVEENEHLVTFTPWVRQMNRIFKNRGSEYLRSEIQATFGSGMMNDINSYINEVARPQAFNEDTGLDGLVRVLRGGIYTGYLGAKASSVVLQGITSPMPFLRFVNPVQLAKGIIDFTTHPVESWRMITTLSPFMERRSMNPTVEEIRQDAAEGGNGKVKKAYHKAQNAVMQPLEWIDRWAVASGWLAVYNKKLSEFEYQNDIESMKEAAHYADTVVYQTQPNGVSSELAPMFKGSGAVKIFTQFQTALNTIWQNVAYDTVQDFRTSRDMKKAGNNSYKHLRNRGLMTLIGYSTAGLLLALVAEGFDDDDEDKDKLKKLLAGTTSQITDSVPLVGSYMTSLLKTVITGENQPSISSSLYPGFDRIVSGLKTGLAGKNKAKGWYNVAQGAGLLVGFPVNGIKEWYSAVTGDPQVLLGRDKK